MLRAAAARGAKEIIIGLGGSATNDGGSGMARCDRPRVIWADVGRSVRAALLAPGDPTVALNSCYVICCPTLDDAFALVALLNSPLASAWLSLA